MAASWAGYTVQVEQRLKDGMSGGDGFKYRLHLGNV